MKSVLILIPYENIYPPMNGGMQRCFHILHQLALHFNVTAIIHQDTLSFQKAFSFFPALAKVTICSTKEEEEVSDMVTVLPTRIKNALRYRWYKRTLMDTTDSNFLLYYPVLRRLLKMQRFDFVVLENLDTINATGIIRRYGKSTPVFFDAHNVDSLLAKEKVTKKEMPSEYMLGIKETESNLYKAVDGIITCSEKDLNEFKAMNRGKLRGQVIPNGVNLEATLFDEGVRLDDPEYILFCGSLYYEPNIEGIDWFCDKIWPSIKKDFPALKLLVAGNGQLPPHLDHLTNDATISFTGGVADIKPYYNKATVAIVPLKSGSGTRLKILEAMGLGVPVISTSKGAEGIDCIDGVDIVIADDEQTFIKDLTALLRKKENRIRLQQAARLLVQKKYDWNIIGLTMFQFMNELSDKLNSVQLKINHTA